MFDRIAPVYDVMNRVMTAGLDQRWRRLTVARRRRPETACSTPAAAPATSRSRRGRPAPRSSGSTSPGDARARAAARTPSVEWVQGDLLELPFEDGVVRRGDGRLRRAQRRRPRARPRRAAPRAASGRPRRHPRDHPAARAAAALLPALVRRPDPAGGQDPPRWQGLHVPPGERAPLPRPGRAGRR